MNNKNEGLGSAAAVAATRVSIDEFCTRASIADTRVELLSAFAAREKGAGRVLDTEDAFAGRLKEFSSDAA